MCGIAGRVASRVPVERDLVSTRSDKEVIVHMCEEIGGACVERHLAFAFLGPRRQRLLLARDRLGKKLLCAAQRRVLVRVGDAGDPAGPA